MPSKMRMVIYSVFKVSTLPRRKGSSKRKVTLGNINVGAGPVPAHRHAKSYIHPINESHAETQRTQRIKKDLRVLCVPA